MKIFIIIFILVGSLFSSSSDVTNVWKHFKKSFIKQDAKVVDPHNGYITHTEGIGYALYFSYSMDDKESFISIYNWMKSNLKVNKFGLFGWKKGDLTSATDANLWIAYSLYLMYDKTKYKPYKDDADRLIKAIKEHQIIITNKQMFLLPWEKSLVKEDNIRVNPSYIIFEIFEYMALVDDSKFWNKLIQDSTLLLKKARFSSLTLNSDWIIYNLLTDSYSLPKKYKFFGYDAIRIPLNIIRSHLSLKEKKELLKPYKNYLMMMVNIPLGVVELERGDISIYNLSFGHLAVYIKIADFFEMDSTLFKQILHDRITNDNEDYYSYSLYLFTLLH